MTDGSIYLNRPLPLGRLAKALNLAEEQGDRKKPLYIDLSGKAWKLLLLIRKTDKTFLPDTESTIWLQAERMGL